MTVKCYKKIKNGYPHCTSTSTPVSFFFVPIFPVCLTSCEIFLRLLFNILSTISTNKNYQLFTNQTFWSYELQSIPVKQSSRSLSLNVNIAVFHSRSTVFSIDLWLSLKLNSFWSMKFPRNIGSSESYYTSYTSSEHRLSRNWNYTLYDFGYNSRPQINGPSETYFDFIQNDIVITMFRF